VPWLRYQVREMLIGREVNWKPNVRAEAMAEADGLGLDERPRRPSVGDSCTEHP
jgi:hypothetical protein